MKTASVELYTRNNWYYAKITRPHGAGRAVRTWLKTKSEVEARQNVKDWKLEEMARADNADAMTREVWTRMIAGRKVTIRQSMDDYREHLVAIGRPALSIESCGYVLDLFVRDTMASGEPEFGTQTIGAITPKHVSEWANIRNESKLTTRNSRLMTVKSWLDWCVSQRWLVINPAQDVVVRLDQLTQEQLLSKPHVALTEEEVKTLLTHIPRTNFWHGAVLFAYHLGLRRSAIALMEETNVVGHQLKLYTTKGKRVVNERLPDEIIAWLDEWRKVRPASDTTYLFPEEAALGIDSPNILSQRFRKLANAAGLPKVKFHGIRKTSTANRWSAELDQLGNADKRALMGLIAKNGFKKVQEMLAHAPGSDVTERHYMPTKSDLG